MADETDTLATSEVMATEAPAEVPAVKKQRGPRRSKSALSAAAVEASALTAPSSSTDVKSPKARVKRSARAEATSAALETAGAAKKKTGRGKTGKATALAQGKTLAVAAVAAADEMNDIIRLEKENVQLRKALGEKLRAENADLRKRLGV